MPFGISLDGSKFAHTWMGKRATRWLREQFDKLGKDNLRHLIQNNRNLLDLFPKDAIAQYRNRFRLPKDYTDAFTDEEVYSWVPEEYRVVIESEPNGRQWAQLQVKAIRDIILTP